MLDGVIAPLVIVADTYQIACDYARSRDVPWCDWHYARDPRHVQNQHGPGRYVVVTIPGALLTTADAERRVEILDYLQAHGFTPLDEGP